MASLLRPASRRTLPLVALLGATLMLAGLLAFEAWEAARSNRSTAEKALRDYASFAAWGFALAAKQQMHEALHAIFRPVQRLDGVDAPATLPRPAVLAPYADEAARCGACVSADSTRYFFVYDRRTDSLIVEGPGRPSAAEYAFVKDTVTPRSRRALTERDFHFGYLPVIIAGKEKEILLSIIRDRTGAPVAVYGSVGSIDPYVLPNFPRIVQSVPLLPLSLTRESYNDSLLSVRVSARDGRILYRSPVQYRSSFTSSVELADIYGSLRVTVMLRPDVAERLIIGGLPRSHLPLLLSLLAVTIGLFILVLRQLRREVELAKLRSGFIANVSHELRTPLAQIRLFTETLRLGRVRSDRERTRALEIIDQEALRLGHLVENVLQYSRAERGVTHLAPTAAPLLPDILEAAEAFEPIARARQSRLQVEVPSSLVATFDRGALRQTLVNLLDNAVKYGPAGQTITITARARGRRIRIGVSDEGPGIPTSERERVWEAFTRLDRDVDAAISGSGIGLAVVKHLAEMQHGRAWIDTGVTGRGTQVVIELPGTPWPGASSGMDARAALEVRAEHGPAEHEAGVA